MSIRIELSEMRKPKPAWDTLSWGKEYTDHIFLMDYTEGKGWFDPRIIPYTNVTLDPATTVLHYGQGTFEGLKAYYKDDKTTLLFRPMENVRRLNRSNARLCIPQIDEQLCLDAIVKLVQTEREWVPDLKGTSLYIRPFVIATDPFLGVRPSDNFAFYIILSPCANYYPEGLAPVKIYVEDQFVRAAKGGLGEAKTMANYAASLLAQKNAKVKGFTQALWLDAHDRKYIEEVGTMNVFFVIGDTVITPALEGSVLPGITRASVLELLRSKGYKTEERRISIDEVIDAAANGTLKEVFGTGTAAVISPVGQFSYKDKLYEVNDGQIGTISKMLYDELLAIQTGMANDPFGWVMTI